MASVAANEEDDLNAQSILEDHVSRIWEGNQPEHSVPPTEPKHPICRYSPIGVSASRSPSLPDDVTDDLTLRCAAAMRRVEKPLHCLGERQHFESRKRLEKFASPIFRNEICNAQFGDMQKRSSPLGSSRQENLSGTVGCVNHVDVLSCCIDTFSPPEIPVSSWFRIPLESPTVCEDTTYSPNNNGNIPRAYSYEVLRRSARIGGRVAPPSVEMESKMVADVQTHRVHGDRGVSLMEYSNM